MNNCASVRAGLGFTGHPSEEEKKSMASASDGCKWVIHQGSRGPALLSKHRLGSHARAQPAVTGSIEEMSQLGHTRYVARSTSAAS